MNLHCIEETRCGKEELVLPVDAAGGLEIRVHLSKRQEEILVAASQGTPDKIIAGNLGVSPRTLEGHWRAIHRKLGSVNRCQAGFRFAGLRGNALAKVLG